MFLFVGLETKESLCATRPPAHEDRDTSVNDEADNKLSGVLSSLSKRSRGGDTASASGALFAFYLLILTPDT